jgi:hypothetical protein
LVVLTVPPDGGTKSPSPGSWESGGRCGEAVHRPRRSWSCHLMSFPFVSPKMEKEVSDFIQDSGQVKKKFQPMNKIERSIL